ncbi:hypothetical protein CLOLEP_00540 [[Clostridium] leptum DSM 753]|uniref:Uncharacterized protein n=1 Tax=[Clostridium] leptum DSM 753 TaxID=428125 RepID=A7VPR4_9FIRM|nr:hypothetical protein CLOLEP_00540 [[Clostridium] leptum DSM 753]
MRIKMMIQEQPPNPLLHIMKSSLNFVCVLLAYSTVYGWSLILVTNFFTQKFDMGFFPGAV